MGASKKLYPLILVDIALFGVEDGRLRVLLVRRANEPEMHRWALPGGMLQPETDADLEAAARRVLQTKVSVDVPHLEEVRTFSGRDRDPRAWSISVLFYALLPRDRMDAVVRTKVEAVAWADPADTGPLAFDHDAQVSAALGLLRDKVERHALPLHLLAERFTLTELQRTREAILGRALEKSAFRRRLRGSPDLVEIEEEFLRGPQRPAQVYRARSGFAF